MATDHQALADRVREAALELLRYGYDGTTVDMPELGEQWTLSREGAEK